MAEDAPMGEPGTMGGEPPVVGVWLARWIERVADEDLPMPEDEGRRVVRAVLAAADGRDDDGVDRAGRAWGRTHRSVATLVRRLSALREAFATWGVDEPLRMHRALDRITADATEEVMRRLEHASRTDPLTGVGNRRAFEETLGAALSAATRQGHEITVVEVDLDGLKRINDEQGHVAGDAALLALVRSFYAALRDEDTVFRVGGDEFMILLPFTSAETAAILMERVTAGDAPPFTWGASGFPGDGADAGALVEAADRDLYRRRHLRRAPRRAGRVAAAMPIRLGGGSRWRRMAWIPAAAILLVSLSLVATLTAGPALRTITSATPKHGVATKPGGGTGATSPGGSGSTTGGGTGFGSGPGTGVTATPVGFVTSGPAGGSATGTGGGTTPPSSGGTNPGPNPPPRPPAGGGVLGLVSSMTAPLPLVGGSTGLVSTVSQVLTGAPTTTTATGTGSTTGTVGTVLTGLLG